MAQQIASFAQGGPLFEDLFGAMFLRVIYRSAQRLYLFTVETVA
jgi:hypothetical protein